MISDPTSLAATVLPILLDRDSTEPIYVQLYKALADAIVAGRLDAGARLPATRRLAAEHGISRNTVVLAYEQLTAEGYVTGRQGSGTRVAADVAPLLDPPETRPSAPTDRPVYAPAPAFSVGPALDQFPFKAWGAAQARAWRNVTEQHLDVQEAEGLWQLREEIARYVRAARGVNCAVSDVLIVTGVQQALRLVMEALTEESDRVLLEDPGYPRLRSAVLVAGRESVPIAVDGEGFVPGEKGKLYCLCPSRQFPLGMTMGVERRMAVLDHAARGRAWVFEDDYDSEFRYRGRPMPSLQGLDRAGRVVYFGSFSKVLFTSLRLGYLIVPAGARARFEESRGRADAPPPILPQLALAEFIRDGSFESHIRRMRTLYARRLATFLEIAEREWADLFSIEQSDSGMHVIARALPELAARMGDREITERGAEVGAQFWPVSDCYTDQVTAPRGFAVGFTATDEKKMARVAARLRRALS